MNMLNLDMYAMRQMRNYRLRVKFAKFPYSGGCGITVRTTLFDAIEGYSYTDEDLKKYGASELIRQSISKFVETHEHELFTASLSQEIRDIIQRFKLHYTISYTIRGRNCTVWSDLFDCNTTYNYIVTRSNRVVTNAQVIEDAIRTFYNDNSNIFNKEETTMENEKNVREELSSWIAAYSIKNMECRKLSEELSHETSENEALKDTISKCNEDLRKLAKKNESLAEDVDMYQHLLMEMNVDNEKLKDTVRMLRETIRGKDTAIQDDAEKFREMINKLRDDRAALIKENIRLCKKRLNEVYGES